MTCWIFTVFVDPGIKTREIDILYFFVFRDFIIKLAGIRAAAEKALPGV